MLPFLVNKDEYNYINNFHRFHRLPNFTVCYHGERVASRNSLVFFLQNLTSLFALQ